MATTYYSDKTSLTNVKPAKVLAEGGVISSTGYAAQTVDFVINDVVQMIKIPAGATVLDVILTVEELDTGTAIVVAVGDGADDDRFITASTVGQAGGVERSNVLITAAGAGVPYTYAADDTIDFKVTTAPTTAVTDALVRLTVLYTTNP